MYTYRTEVDISHSFTNTWFFSFNNKEGYFMEENSAIFFLINVNIDFVN